MAKVKIEILGAFSVRSFVVRETVTDDNGQVTTNVCKYNMTDLTIEIEGDTLVINKRAKERFPSNPSELDEVVSTAQEYKND